MSSNDGWQYQGRQEHGRFGNGTKPAVGTAVPVSYPGAAAQTRSSGFGRSYRWPGSRLVKARSTVPVAPVLPIAPFELPNPSTGPMAAARAQQRVAHVMDLFHRGKYAAVAGHLLLGRPFPNEIDDPEPEKLPAPEAGGATVSSPNPDDDPGGRKRGELIVSHVKLTEAERRSAKARVSEGGKVEVIPTDPTAPTADFFVDGVHVELKTMDPTDETDPGRLSAIISTRIARARRQSSNVAVDATAAPGQGCSTLSGELM